MEFKNYLCKINTSLQNYIFACYQRVQLENNV